MSDVTLTEDDGPECETCGKTTCPDANLASFSAPIDCDYAPIYEALHDAKDCDYGCARDLTNQGVRLEVVPVVESIAAARLAEVAVELETMRDQRARRKDHDAEVLLARVETAEAEVTRLRDTLARVEALAAKWEHHATLFAAPADHRTREDWEYAARATRAALAGGDS